MACLHGRAGHSLASPGHRDRGRGLRGRLVDGVDVRGAERAVSGCGLRELPDCLAQVTQSGDVCRRRPHIGVIQVEDERQPVSGVCFVMYEFGSRPTTDAARVHEVQAGPTGPESTSSGGIECLAEQWHVTSMTGNVPEMTTVTRLQPAGLPTNPAFAWGVSVEGPVRTVYVGGQNGIGPDGTLVGNDIAAQTKQALRNVGLVLAEADAALSDIVHWRIALVQGASLQEGFAAFQEEWGQTPDAKPAITVDIVAGLARPDFLVELTATAVVAL